MLGPLQTEAQLQLSTPLAWAFLCRLVCSRVLRPGHLVRVRVRVRVGVRVRVRVRVRARARVR
eukprot:scaffold14276_cov45-Phaeocystis_antarctica.AAC.1